MINSYYDWLTKKVSHLFRGKASKKHVIEQSLIAPIKTAI
jgi:hypothetical protein